MAARATLKVIKAADPRMKAVAFMGSSCFLFLNRRMPLDLDGEVQSLRHFALGEMAHGFRRPCR
jgi:hypothetical protein